MTPKSIPFEIYALLEDEECEARIVAAKAKLGKRCVILGHHYQRDEVFRHADFTGDSLKLSRLASQSEAEYIVFCGVHFMAEVADNYYLVNKSWSGLGSYPTQILQGAAGSGGGGAGPSITTGDIGTTSADKTGNDTQNAVGHNNLPPFYGVYFIKRTSRIYYTK